MAKKKNPTARKAENAKPAAKPQTQIPAPAVQAKAETQTELKIANPEKSKGSVQYRIPGVAGSLRVTRSLFGGTPPARLVVVGPFAQPDPEKAAKARATAEQKAAKLEARIAKTTERLERLRAKLEVKR